MKKLLLTLLFFSAFFRADAQFGQLLGWQLSNPAPMQPAGPSNAIYKALGMESSKLDRGAGLLPATLARSFSSTSASYSAGNNPTVRNANEYYQFTAQAEAGRTMSLSGIGTRLRRTGGGPNTYRWAYSINDGAFIDIGTDVSFGDTNTAGVLQPIINLTSIPELQNLSSSTKVTFRLYGWGFSSSTGTFAFGQYAATDLTHFLALYGELNGSTNLLGWDMNVAVAGGATTGGEATVVATNVNSNLNASTLVRNGFGNGSLPRGVSAIGTIGSTKVDGEYFEFDVTPNAADKYVTLSAIDARLRRTSGGATTHIWSYSKNNGAFVDIGTPITLLPSDEGYAQASIDLSAIADLKNMPSTTVVKLRLHAWGFTTAAGTFAIGRYAADQNLYSLQLRGQVTDQPLPVKLTSFTAKANKQGAVNLAWATASEQNNSHFDITRSANGEKFEKIGEVKGNNNSDVTRNYSYTDVNPIIGANYYRLTQVDHDGKSSFSNIAVAKVGLDSDNLTVAVAADRSSIEVAYHTATNGKALFVIYSVTGAKLTTVEKTVSVGNNQISIPVNLSKSLHVIKVSQAGASVSAKF